MYWLVIHDVLPFDVSDCDAMMRVAVNAIIVKAMAVMIITATMMVIW